MGDTSTTKSDTPNPINTVVIKRTDGIDADVVAKTPAGMPNIAAKALQPIEAIAIRCLRVYLQTFLGIATALQTGYAHKVGVDFDTHDLTSVIVKSAMIAIAPVFFTFIQNALELLTKLDETNPALRG